MNGSKQRHRFIAACDAVASATGLTPAMVVQVRPHVCFEVRSRGSKRVVELLGGKKQYVKRSGAHHISYSELLGYGSSRRATVDMAIGVLKKRARADRAKESAAAPAVTP